MDDIQTVGEWLRRRRHVLGFTQRELAERVGCAFATIRKLESGERRPSAAVAEHLAEQLGVSPDQRALFVRCVRGDMPVACLPPPALLGESAQHIVTLLLLDIGSDLRWQRRSHADARQSEVRGRALQAIAACNGRLIPGADGLLMATFAMPGDALAATLRMFRDNLNRPDGGGVSSLRAAIHTDAPGDAVSGPLLAWSRAMLAVATPGQCVLSAATAELVRDTLPVQAQLRDLGNHRLPGTPRPLHLFQVLGPALAATLPALTPRDNGPGNLPAALTPLVGRERELADIRALLRRGARLVTLTGPGGVGKTRLAFALANAVQYDFADGACAVELAPISDPALVATAIAAALRLADSGGEPLSQQLQHAMRPKHMLLVLDNYEQVLEAAPLVADLLRAAPHVIVVATSRSALQISGEYEYAVQPLAVPAAAGLESLEQLSQYAAVTLFLNRAEAVGRAIAVTPATAPLLAEICQRLDGLPLAIELAAARLRQFDPPELLARLHNPLALLTGGARDLPQRQQTLRAMIAWSYDLLAPAEQAAFRRMGVFAGHFGADAALAVLENLAEAPTLLAALEQDNLLTRVARPGEQRFRMLETLREYAREALAGDQSASQAHAAFYLARAETAEAQLGGPQQQHWLAVLGDEHDNIRAALQWAIDHDDAPTALRLAGAMVRFWDVRGFLTEGRFWLESALALPQNGVAAAVLLRALNAAATLARRQSDLAHARALFEQALVFSRAAGERWWESIVLNGLALVLRREGKLEQAAALFEHSLAVCRAVGNHQGAAAAIGNLGSIATLQGDTARAIDIQQQGLELARQQHNPRDIAESLNNLATAYHAAGDWERADQLQRESLELYRNLGDRYGMALVEYNLADRARAWGRLEQARTWCHHSLRTYDEIGEKAGVVECIELAAGIAIRDNRADWAVQLLSAMDEQRVLLGAPRTTAEQADVAHGLEVARSALGDALFDVAQSSGRHMALNDAAEQVLAYSAPPPHAA